MTAVYKTMNCQIIWKSRGVQELSGKSLSASHQILTRVWDPKEDQKSWPSRKQNSPYIHPFTSVTILHWNLLLLLNFIAPTKDEVYSQHQSIKPVTFSLYSHLKELPWLKNSSNNRKRNHIQVVLVKNSEQTLKPCNHSGLEDSFPGTNSPVFSKDVRDLWNREWRWKNKERERSRVCTSIKGTELGEWS